MPKTLPSKRKMDFDLIQTSTLIDMAEMFGWLVLDSIKSEQGRAEVLAIIERLHQRMRPPPPLDLSAVVPLREDGQ